MLVDQHSGDICIPLNQLCGRGERTGRLEICNSILSEEAVMVSGAGQTGTELSRRASSTA